MCTTVRRYTHSASHLTVGSSGSAARQLRAY